MRQRGYPRFYVAATTARLANEMFAVTVVLLVIQRTGSAAVAGATVAAVTLPSVISGPFLGALLDRRARRGPLIALDQALSVSSLAALLALTGHIPDVLVPALALPAGLTFALSAGGFTSLVPAAAPAILLPGANALEAASFNGAVIAGPALAGVVVAGAGPATAVATQLGIKLAALGLSLRLPEPGAGMPERPVMATVRAGLRQLWSSRPLLAVTVAGTMGMLGRGLLVVGFPLFAAETLGAGRGLVGYLWAALALGSIAGTLGLLRMQERRAAERIVVGSLGLAGIVMLSWPLATAPAVALVLVALGGLAQGPALTATFAVRQQLAPRHLHGQVFMTAASLKIGAFAAGSALGGLAAATASPRTLLVGAAALHLLGGSAGLLLLGRRSSAQGSQRESPKSSTSSSGGGIASSRSQGSHARSSS